MGFGITVEALKEKIALLEKELAEQKQETEGYRMLAEKYADRQQEVEDQNDELRLKLELLQKQEPNCG